MNDCLKVDLQSDGQILVLTLSRPPQNILDLEMVNHLNSALDKYSANPDLCAVLIDSEGRDFSHGASIQEHLPDQFQTMLNAMGKLVISLIAYPVPIFTIVRGYCLGGGLELACAGSQIYAHKDAKFGQPEIKLAVTSPYASVLLMERMNRSMAEDILFSGRIVNAIEAKNMGIIDNLSDDPKHEVVRYLQANLLKLSSYSLRYAVKAARIGYIEQMKQRIKAVEQQYIELMQGEDPLEGLNAFLEKRPPQWKNR